MQQLPLSAQDAEAAKRGNRVPALALLLFVRLRKCMRQGMGAGTAWLRFQPECTRPSHLWWCKAAARYLQGQR